MCKAWIQGIDFDSAGNKIASIDEAGRMLACDVIEGTKTYFDNTGRGYGQNRCKWKPIFGDTIVAFTSGKGSLELYNIEKNERLNKKDIELESGSGCKLVSWFVFNIVS